MELDTERSSAEEATQAIRDDLADTAQRSIVTKMLRMMREREGVKVVSTKETSGRLKQDHLFSAPRQNSSTTGIRRLQNAEKVSLEGHFYPSTTVERAIAVRDQELAASECEVDDAAATDSPLMRIEKAASPTQNCDDDDVLKQKEREKAEETSEVAALEAARDSMLVDFAEHGGIIPREERERMWQLEKILTDRGIDCEPLTGARQEAERKAGMLYNDGCSPGETPLPSPSALPSSILYPSQPIINTSPLLLPLPSTSSHKANVDKVVEELEDSFKCAACLEVKDVNICLTCHCPSMCTDCIVRFASETGDHFPDGKYGRGETSCSRCRAPWRLEGNSATGFITVTGGLADAVAGLGRLRNTD